MKACVRFLWSGVIAACLVTAGRAAQDETTSNRPIEVESYLETVIPSDLRHLLMREAWVRFLITVDADGKLIDHLPVEASHYGLLDRADKCLLGARFTPAISDGKPVRSSAGVVVTFFDPEQRAFHSGLISMPHGSSSMDAAVRWMSEPGRDSLRYGLSPVEDLDRPLEMKSGRILVLTDDKGRAAEGNCVLEYYIDTDGVVRLPRILSADNDVVARSAILTVRESRFGPITRNGRPTYVKVRQPMMFHLSEERTVKP